MKKISKLIGILMVLTLLCCAVFAMTTTASAAAPSSVKINGITVEGDKYLAEGASSTVSTKPSGGYAYYNGTGILTLYNFDVSTSTARCIYADGDLIISLSGTNTLTEKGNYNAIQVTGTLTFTGSGSLTVNKSGTDTLVAISGKDVNFTGGTLNVTCPNNCIKANGSMLNYGGTITLNTTGKNAALYVTGRLNMYSGKLTVTSKGTGVYVNGGTTEFTGGTVKVTSDSSSIISKAGNVTVAKCDMDLTVGNATGIYALGYDVTFKLSAWVKINSGYYGITGKNVLMDSLEDTVLVSGQTKALDLSGTVSGGGIGISYSKNANGSYPVPPDEISLGDVRYAYFRPVDVYVGGIPMSIGDYLHQSWSAASTYKPSDNYARVDLNGDTNELYLKNFNLDTTNNKITSTAISTSSSLKLYLDGTNYIKSGTGDAINLSKGSMQVISGGTLNINTTSGIGINLKSGDYIHGGNAIINITSTKGTGINLLNQNITVKSGELNVTAKYDGIHCVNFTITGGKVDTRSTNNENNKGLSYTTLSYGSLTAKAASTADGALVNLTSAHKTANKRVVIASHICTGQSVAAKAATCTTAGKRAYYKCSCGKFYEDANCTKVISNLSTWGNIRPTGHTPIAGWKTNGTYHWKTCTKCNIAEIPNTKVKHSGGEATCRAKAMCDVCKAYYGELGNHKWSTTWDYATAEGHTHFCVNDGCDFVSGYEKHVPDIAAPTETKDQKCKLCNYVIAPALGHVCKSHVFKVDYHGATCIDYGNIEYYECTCGKYYKDKNATQEITDKSSVRIPKADHEYLDNWYSDANGHWQQCDCMRKGNEATHKDDNADYVCDVCSYKLPEPATQPTTPTDPTNPTDPTDPTDPVDPTTQPTTGNPGGEGSATPAPTTPAGEGDNSGDGGSNLWWLWIVIAAVAVGGIVFFIVFSKKKKEE